MFCEAKVGIACARKSAEATLSERSFAHLFIVSFRGWGVWVSFRFAFKVFGCFGV